MLVRDTDCPVFYVVVREFLSGTGSTDLSLRAGGADRLSEFLVGLVHRDMLELDWRQRALPAPRPADGRVVSEDDYRARYAAAYAARHGHEEVA